MREPLAEAGEERNQRVVEERDPVVRRREGDEPAVDREVGDDPEDRAEHGPKCAQHHDQKLADFVIEVQALFVPHPRHHADDRSDGARDEAGVEPAHRRRCEIDAAERSENERNRSAQRDDLHVSRAGDDLVDAARCGLCGPRRCGLDVNHPAYRVIDHVRAHLRNE